MEYNIPLKKILKENLDELKKILNECDDIIFRELKAGSNKPVSMELIFVDGMIDRDDLSSFVLRPLLRISDDILSNGNKSIDSLIDMLSKENIQISDMKVIQNMEEVIKAVLSGETVLLIDGSEKAIDLSTRGWPSRSIGEPVSEETVRGPRDGMTETLKTNIALIRRRIRDTNLKVKMMQIGKRSKTDMAVMYMEDIVEPRLLNETYKRLNNLNIDEITDSSMLESLIEDHCYSPFPQIENTERPDAVAASLYEGRVAIIVDNSPFALLVPATVGTLMQSTEDYYTRWSVASIVRIIRYFAAFLAVLAPSLYIAVTSYHPGLLPTRLAYYVAASRVNVPFPSVIEAFLMEITLELLREAGTRISGPIGTTIGIVGGLIIGQAAVDAGIVSPLMIIIVSVTTISSFAIPSYELAAALRSFRFLFMIYAAVLGLYGVMLGIIVMITHMAKLDSFGIPFTSPYSGLGREKGDLRDTIIRAPFQNMKKRPRFTFPKNRTRLK
ncbi:MAG: spore germination protein [Tissierellaceae bacterium]|nr:spore germination protein [Tissierellaceae bacterium]